MSIESQVLKLAVGCSILDVLDKFIGESSEQYLRVDIRVYH